MEYLDPWTSRAFAVVDHQLAHVYVPDAADVPEVLDQLVEIDGVAEVLDGDGGAAYGLDHERAGELTIVAEPDAWCTYYYWLDDARARTSPAASTSTANLATTSRNSSWTRATPGSRYGRRWPPAQND